MSLEDFVVVAAVVGVVVHSIDHTLVGSAAVEWLISNKFLRISGDSTSAHSLHVYGVAQLIRCFTHVTDVG